MARVSGDHGQNGHNKGGLRVGAETIAFMMLAGIVVGLLVGYGLDRLLRTTPVRSSWSGSSPVSVSRSMQCSLKRGEGQDRRRVGSGTDERESR